MRKPRAWPAYRFAFLVALLSGCSTIPVDNNYDVREFVCTGPVDNAVLLYECKKFILEGIR